MRTRQQRRSRVRGNTPTTIRRVLGRDGYACVVCGGRKGDASRRQPDTALKLQVAHIVAVKDGGSDELANLRTLCTDCHHEEHHG